MTAGATVGVARRDRVRAAACYLAVAVVGVAAFAWPFLLPAASAPTSAHAVDAPIVGAVVAAAALAAVVVEVRIGRMNGATVAVIGVLAAVGALARLLSLPGGGSGIFFVIVLAGAALGARPGLLLGLAAMATSAVITGGIGPWLPFQMLALGAMGAGAGALRGPLGHLRPWGAIAVLAIYGWAWGFIYGAIMNLWFWPFVIDGSPLSYDPSLGARDTVARYASFYVVTSFAWDAAGALANAVLIGLAGRPVLRALRRVAGRLDPVVDLEPAAEAADTEAAGDTRV